MIFVVFWLALSLPPPVPAFEDCEKFRHGLPHLPNPLKQSLIRKDLTTITHRHALTSDETRTLKPVLCVRFPSQQTDPAEHKNSKGRSCRHTEHHCCLDDRVAHWTSSELVPCDVDPLFDKFLVSPLRAMASSPDLSGNELSRDRSSRNDHRPQVPTARLSVCRHSSV